MKIKDYLEHFRRINWRKVISRAKAYGSQKPVNAGALALLVLILLKIIFNSSDSRSKGFSQPTEVNFKSGRILNERESTFYHGRERQLSKTAQGLIESEQKLAARLSELEAKLKENGNEKAISPLNLEVKGPDSRKPDSSSGAVRPLPADKPLELYPQATVLEGTAFPGEQVISKTRRGRGASATGKELISFPVKGENIPEGVMLPAGSYVKAKILTGVEVPEGKTYPVLLVLDFSYIAPNDHKIDLSGCFMIAKAEGDLSTERVQMQATKMSCVSKHGKMFEREVSGFIADDQDGSFAMKGQVNSKQGRVAAVAFLASVVDGVGKAVQAAQTSQSVNALGGSQSVMTGDSGKYVVAGGAANAAGMVAQWYLQQAQSLAPTVAVNSGRDVWIVMKDKVTLPFEFFKKEGKPNEEGIYSYLTRVVD